MSNCSEICGYNAQNPCCVECEQLPTCKHICVILGDDWENWDHTTCEFYRTSGESTNDLC